MNSYSLENEALTVFPYLSALIGGYLFAAIYTDDLNSKNLITLVGFGLGKTRIIISKLILMTLVAACIYAVIPLWAYGVLAVLGHVQAAAALGTAYAFVFKILLTTIVYGLIGSIVVYGVQRTTFAIVTYLVFALGIVDGMLFMMFKIPLIAENVPTIGNYLVESVTTSIFKGIVGGTSISGSIIVYIIYIAVPGILSILAFRKKEMEF
jgi:ABC-type transport system involved in multi-copper enzyme maturation permease subunit